jgi:hypothetical protein
MPLAWFAAGKQDYSSSAEHSDHGNANSPDYVDPTSGPVRETHEQQLRTLERKSDVPDARRIDTELDKAGEDNKVNRPDQQARASEFAVSRGGLHQESDHNKHHRSGQSGHKPQRDETAQEKH